MDTSDLAGLQRNLEEIAADLDVWAGRQEPDARARRYGSAAVKAIDAALAELHQIRARLTAELRDADNQTDARADALLADTRALLADAQPPAADCGCPRGDGEIRHQRGTCTDPVVAKLNWYADDTPPPAVMDEFRQATRHHWSPPPALEGYGYVLPEDYLRGGAQ